MTQEEGEHTGSPTTIVECDPPRRLVVESGSRPADDVADGARPLAEDGRTVLVFLQFFPPDADVADVAVGWHWYLDKLDAEVGGRPARPTGRRSSPRSARATARRPERSAAAPSTAMRGQRRGSTTTTGVSTGSKPPGRRCRRPTARTGSPAPSRAEHRRASAGRGRPGRRGQAPGGPSLGGEHVGPARCSAVPAQKESRTMCSGRAAHERDVVVALPRSATARPASCGDQLDARRRRRGARRSAMPATVGRGARCGGVPPAPGLLQHSRRTRNAPGAGVDRPGCAG